jgi:hypothetical protein
LTSLENYPSSKFNKLLYLGESGVGKTGSLVSLVKAGYKLKILDMDNNLGVLIQYIRKECPELIGNVDAESLRDEFKMTLAGPMVVGQPKAMVSAMKLLTKWSDDSIPCEWGEDTILVVDSTSSLGNAAFEWARAMAPSVKDPRQWYGTAQDAVEHCVALLTSPEFHAHVIVIAHVDIRELTDGTTKGFPTAIGKALGPVLPRYFGTMILADRTGTGDNLKRMIRTLPTSMLDLKTPAPFKIGKDLPLETGLADLFNQLKAD